MADGPAGFTQDFSCPALLRILLRFIWLRVRGDRPLWHVFQTFPLTIFHAISQSYNPNNAGTSLVWALPRSLATTWGIIRLFSLPTGTKMFQFPAFAHYIRSVSNLQLDGLSHSEILGSMVICTYPRLFAAYHVLHRLQEPRHPPYALSYLFSALLLLMSGVC